MLIIYGKPNEKAIGNHAVPSKYLHREDDNPVPSLNELFGKEIDYLYNFIAYGGCNMNHCVNDMTLS
jgi:hypothetical protein